MKVTITIETDAPVVHLTAVANKRVSLLMNPDIGDKMFQRLSDNSIIISDA